MMDITLLLQWVLAKRWIRKSQFIRASYEIELELFADETPLWSKIFGGKVVEE